MNTSQIIQIIQNMESACFSKPYTYEMIAADLLKDHSIFLFAVNSGRIINPKIEDLHADEVPAAYCCGEVITSGQLLEILRIAVLPEFRNQGFARRLMIFIEQLIKEKQIYKILLEVSDSNENAMKLYEKLGYKQYNLRKSYYPDGTNALMYQKTL